MSFEKMYMDGFTGAILAVESFKDVRAVLHGPGGCRSYMTSLSRQCYPRMRPDDFKEYQGSYFFGQRRVPCTYIDENDYINGAMPKIEESIPIICDMDGKAAVFIKSPGASLIGDNITDAIERLGYSNKAMAIEESLISAPFSSSYDRTIKEMLAWKNPQRGDVVSNSVNILGLPITFNDWQDSLDEFKELLGAIGLNVISSPGAGCTMDGLIDSVNAAFNIIVCPEYGLETARYYEKKYGIPYILCDTGAPVGFNNTENWIRKIATSTKKNPTAAVDIINVYRWRAYKKIKGSLFSQKAKCKTFAITSDSSVALPLAKWLYEFLCMIPESIILDPGADEESVKSLKAFLKEIKMEDVLRKDINKIKLNYVFSDGQTAETLRFLGICDKGIDIGAPSLGRINFIPRPILGSLGAMYFLDEVYSLF